MILPICICMKKTRLSQWARENGLTYNAAYKLVRLRGGVPHETLPSGTILVLENEDIIDGVRPEDAVVIYARVSSSQNKDNLVSQADRLSQYSTARGYRVIKVVREVGSGMNDNRVKLQALLKDDSWRVLVVEHQDRLTRFGFEYLNTLLSMQGKRIEVVNPAEDKEDLMEDFVSIITSFTARIYGRRRSKRRTESIIKELNHEGD